MSPAETPSKTHRDQLDKIGKDMEDLTKMNYKVEMVLGNY